MAYRLNLSAYGVSDELSRGLFKMRLTEPSDLSDLLDQMIASLASREAAGGAGAILRPAATRG